MSPLPADSLLPIYNHPTETTRLLIPTEASTARNYHTISSPPPAYGSFEGQPAPLSGSLNSQPPPAYSSLSIRPPAYGSLEDQRPPSYITSVSTTRISSSTSSPRCFRQCYCRQGRLQRAADPRTHIRCRTDENAEVVVMALGIWVAVVLVVIFTSIAKSVFQGD